MSTWDVEIGDELTRKDRMARFGGAEQGGMEPSASTPNVFLYSDPSRGERYGYDFDGWVGNEFLYTGEGRRLNQEMRDGNRAAAEHAEAGRALRLFVANGYVSGSKTKRQLYIGEFGLNSDEPYFVAEAPDEEGNLRTVFVFRLVPIGDVLRREEDASKSGLPPSTPAVEELDPGAPFEETEVEAADTESYQREPLQSTTALRREGQLVARYRKHLETAGHTLRGGRMRPAGTYSWLRIDLLDTTSGELCEAKGVTTRSLIRLAIGQLMDYRRFVSCTSLSVLLPSRPPDDLLDLLRDLEIACVYEDGPTFVRVDAGGSG